MDKASLELSPFFEVTPDLVCFAGKDGYFKNINNAVVETLGYSREELMQSPIQSFMHPDDRELTIEGRKAIFAGKPLINHQNRYIHKDKSIVWLAWTSIYLPEQDVIFAIAKNITRKKEAEIEIEKQYRKFQSLATHFKSRLEKDRKFVSVELHEELAQLASAVKMDLHWVNANTETLPVPVKDRLEHALSLTELLLHGIRRVSFSISPTMLGDLGLNETIAWLCKEFAILTSIPCDFHGQFEESHLNEEAKLDFFRLCQEALSNVMYHSQASQAFVTIATSDNSICLTIADDGKGFVFDDLKESSGIRNMRERSASINGQLAITSSPGEGTQIVCTLPISS